MWRINQATQGKLYLTGAFALAGTSVVMGYMLTETLGTFTITAISMLIVIAGLLPFLLRRTLQTMQALTKGQWQLIFAQAFFGIFLFRMFLLLGVQHTSTAEAGILTGAIPALTAVGAYFVLRERPTRCTILGVAATVLGIVLLQGNGVFAAKLSTSHWLGNLLVLLGAASESAFRIISRKQKRVETQISAIHPMVQTLLVSTFALLLSLIPALLEQPWSALHTLSMRDAFVLLWYGLVITALSFGFFYAGAKRCSAYTIAAYSGVMPLTSMLLSVVVLHEPIGFAQVAGGVLVLSGMLLIGLRFNKRASRYNPGITRKG